MEGPGESRFNWLLFRGWGTRGDAVYKTAPQEGELPSLAPTAAERKPSGKDGSGLEWGSHSGRGGLEAAISDPFEVLLAQLHLACFQVSYGLMVFETGSWHFMKTRSRALFPHPLPSLRLSALGI